MTTGSPPVDIGTLIDSDPSLHGERPLLAGTGMTVHAVARRYLNGETAEEIGSDLPHIPLSHIHAAIAYYLANRARIDEDLVRDQREADRLFESWTREKRGGAGS